MSRNIWKLGKEFTDQVSAISYGVIKNHFYDKWVPRKSLLELFITWISAWKSDCRFMLVSSVKIRSFIHYCFGQF